jgi:hypothetical protein
MTFRFINYKKSKVNYEDTIVNTNITLSYIEYIIAYTIAYTINKLKVNSNQIFY